MSVMSGFEHFKANKADNLKEHEGSEMAERREAMVVAVASRAHEDWRSGYRATNGEKPRIKNTKDEIWMRAHGTDQVDIASLPYTELPSDWQLENRLSAESAVDIVLTAVENNQPLDEAFIEKASNDLHSNWLGRNGGWASDVQRLPYVELPEGEKEKDRFFARSAIEAYKRMATATRENGSDPTKA